MGAGREQEFDHHYFALIVTQLYRLAVRHGDAEFRRRASEVAILLSAAGAEVDMEEFEDGGGI